MPNDDKKAAQLMAQLEAFGALEDGNVKPLAEYLIGDGTIAPALRQYLAAMLQDDGDTTYRFDIIGRKRGELGWTDEIARNDHKMEVGMFMERRVRAFGKGGYDSALEDTIAQFEIKKSKVAELHKYVRDILKNYNRRDIWMHLNERYPEPKALKRGVQKVSIIR